MIHKLPPLPFERDELAPHISEETLQYHHGKHHQAYVNNLNKLIAGTEFETMSLEEIVAKSTGGIFNNSAQVFNHTFYWNCLSGSGGGAPSGELASVLIDSFGSLETFKSDFTDAATTHFGSGWAWLVKESSGKLSIECSSNADSPVARGKKPLLTCDLWEHAYYIDYRNARPDYIAAFWNLVNWEFVARNLAG